MSQVLDLQFHLEGSDGLVSMPCDSMLKEARWPAMSALRLVNCTASGEAISAFLASNPQVCKIRPAFTVSQDELDDEDEDIEQGWAVEGVQVPPGCHTTVHDVLWLDMKSALSWSVKHDPRWPLAHEPEFLW